MSEINNKWQQKLAAIRSSLIFSIFLLVTPVIASDEQAQVRMLDNFHRSVVHIMGFEKPGSYLDPKIAEQVKKYFGESSNDKESIFKPIGSGIIYDAAKGYIVTAAHLFDGKEPPYTVVLADKREAEAKLLASSQHSNIALLHIAEDELSAATFNQNLPQMGQTAFIVGLFEQLNSGFATKGMIAGYYEPNNNKSDGLIMLDAVLPSASAGGALINSQGQVWGIASSIYSVRGVDGIACAIPSENIVKAVNDILSSLEPSRSSD